MRSRYSAFVLGEVDGRYFGEYSARSPTPDDVMTTEESAEKFAAKFAEGAPFTALQAEATLTNGSRVFKLFSRQKVRGVVVVGTRSRRFRPRSPSPKYTPRPHLPSAAVRRSPRRDIRRDP